MARRWYLLYPVGPEVHRQALGFVGFSRYGLGRNGCEVITLRRRVSVQWRLWRREEPSMKESTKFPCRNAGLICRVAGRVYWQRRRGRGLGCRGRRSEATARSVALGSGLGSVTGCVVGSPRLEEQNRGGSNGIVPEGSPRMA